MVQTINFIEFKYKLSRKQQKMQPAFTISYQPIPNNKSYNAVKVSPMPKQQSPPRIAPSQQTPRQLTHPPPSKFVGTYAIDFGRQVGHGNFSHVYNAIDQRQPNTKLAVKVVNVEILRGQNLQYLVKSQVQVLLAMRHQNILFCKDAIWDSTYCYIFTEFCQGGSLQSKIRMAQGLPPKTQTLEPQMKIPNISQKQVLPLIKDIFQAMLYMEKNHIIHRDIKAANIFIKENRAIVADFGFARYAHEPFYDLNIGSLPFMPPESLSKNLYSSKTDVWAFGVLLYEIFHGESPYARSHDMKQLIQKAYTPLHISAIRNDLSTQIKQLILNCLQVDMEKRKKFSEMEKLWYCRKLFQNIGQYNYGYRIDRLTLPNSISFNGKPINERNQSGNSNTLSTNMDDLQRSGRMTQLSNRPFGSRFKQKINLPNVTTNMEYSNSNSKGKSKLQNQYLLPEPKRALPVDTPSPKLESRQMKAGTITMNGNKMNNAVITINPDILGNLTPTIKINGKTESSYTQTPKQRQKKTEKQQQIPQRQPQSQRKQRQRSPYLSPTPKQNPQPIPSSTPQQDKISFKDILLHIQEVRNYYKLAITLKDRNQRITDIKNRIFTKCVKQINKIGVLIEKDKIDLTVYDKNNYKGKTRELDQASQNIQVNNRKNKLSSIIADYKTQFQNQIKRRNIKIGSVQDFNSKNTSDFFSTQGSQVSSTSTNLDVGSEIFGITKNGGFKNISPTLAQDLQYVIQNQVMYSAGDSIKMSYEQSQIYRNKLKEILDDIMNIQHGYSSKEVLKKQNSRDMEISQNVDNKANLLKYRSTSPAKLNTSQSINSNINLKLNQNPSFLSIPVPMSTDFSSNSNIKSINNITDSTSLKFDDMEMLSRLRWKQKSSG